ncbi:MAG TPA: STN domain-containing protein [Pirellulaceae bacterium]
MVRIEAPVESGEDSRVENSHVLRIRSPGSESSTDGNRDAISHHYDQIDELLSGSTEMDADEARVEAQETDDVSSCPASSRRKIVYQRFILASLGLVFGMTLAVWLWGPLLVGHHLRVAAEEAAQPLAAVAPAIQKTSERVAHKPMVASSQPHELSIQPSHPSPPTPTSDDAPALEPGSHDGPPREPAVVMDSPSSAGSGATPAADLPLPPFRVAPELFRTPESAGDDVRRRLHVELIPGLPETAAGLKLRQPVAQLNLPDVDLIDFCELVESMAGASLCVRPEALEMARIGQDETVTLQVRRAPLAEVLTQALRPLHLGYRVAGPHIVIEHLAVLQNRPASLKLRVSDLLTGVETRESLLARIDACLGPAKNDRGPRVDWLAWDGDMLVVNESPAWQFEVLKLVERLRIARGLPPRTAYGPRIESRAQGLDEPDEMLGRIVTMSGQREVTLPQFAAICREQAGCLLLLDWPALGQRGFHRGTRLRFTAPPMELGQLLSSVLGAVGLAARAVNAETVRVTTLEEEQLAYELEYYELATILAGTSSSPEQVVEALRGALITSFAEDSRNGDVRKARLVLDLPSQTLIARLAPAQQLQLAAGLDRLARPAMAVAAAQ